MKALLIKDIHLLKSQKQFFGIVALMLVLFTVVQDNKSFAIIYVAMMFSILSMKTMGYDEYENGMCYLMTLPFSRKEYVQSKYVFGILSSFLGLTFSVIFAVAATVAKGGIYPWEELRDALLPCIMLITGTLSVSMPVQLKFGSEKSRVVFLSIYGIGFVAVYGVIQICRKADIRLSDMMSFVKDVLSTPWRLGLICVVVLIASYFLSVRIISRREF